MGSLLKRIGVINWDCSVPSKTTFFGRCATRSLGPREYRDRTPYYAVETAPDTIQYNERDVSDYETELRYAIGAGIDYFAYCWYDKTPFVNNDSPERTEDAFSNAWELAYARVRHIASPLRERLGLCAILIACHHYSQESLDDLALTMKEPFYEKVDGRPLLYIFTSPWEDLLDRLRKCCMAIGTPEPFAVLMANAVSAAEASKVQALSSYGGVSTQAREWPEFFDKAMDRNDLRARSGLPVVPHFSLGWNPSPRIRNPVSWTSYAEGVYAPPATSRQLLAAAERLKVWTQEHEDVCTTGNLLAFAWNEFEEGAWICPTLGSDSDRNPDTHFCEAFAKMVRLWKA